MPIALMIGAGSRTPQLFEHLDKPGAAAKIVCVVSHKALQLDENGHKTKHVVGIQEADDRDIRWDYFNYTQMKIEAKNTSDRRGKKFNEKKFRENYFEILATFLRQSYPEKPVAVFMLGWDWKTTKGFLEYFPSPWEGIYYVINLHPAQLPNNPKDKTVRLPSGIEIPVIRGEHDQVLTDAIEGKLSALGACMHFAMPKADEGGFIIARTEVPIVYKDDFQATFDDYEERLKIAESQMVVDVVDAVAEGRISIEGTTVKVAA